MNIIARTATVLALLFAALSIAPMLGFYLFLEREQGIQFPDNAPRTKMAQTVAEEKDINNLRRICGHLAENSDTFVLMSHLNSQNLKKLSWGFFTILFGWSAIAIAGFLYIARQLRKLSKSSEANNAL